MAFLLIDSQYLVTFSQPTPGYITVQASEKYSSASGLKRIVLGSNYRQEWRTPVTMPVFDIRKTNLKIVDMGGGQQTTSLELIDEQGREWSLRSVDKEVRPPKNLLNNTFAKGVIQDQVSASYPYAGLSIPIISNAAGVPAGEQQLYYVKYDSILGHHNAKMANKVFVLVNNQPQKEKNISTEEMIEKLRNDKNHYVDQEQYLKARLVDWLIADWDRHGGQWRWAEKKIGTRIAFHAVPRDRDQAFFRSNGLLVKLIAFFFMPQLNRFIKNPKGIKGLSKKTRRSDKMFTDQLTKEDWERIIREFQNNISNKVIEDAIKRQPPEIFAIRGKRLIEKLQSRRDGLYDHVMEYYLYLHG
jgi:hypothetical protein